MTTITDHYPAGLTGIKNSRSGFAVVVHFVGPDDRPELDHHEAIGPFFSLETAADFVDAQPGSGYEIVPLHEVSTWRDPEA